MLPFLLDPVAFHGRPIVLAIGAHSDDIEIGCGGTILGLAERYPALEVVWVVLSADTARAAEARSSATEFLAGVSHARVLVEDFPDAFFPHDDGTLRGFFERLKAEVQPDLIFTHRRADSHQDHRIVCDLTWNTFRDSVILEYEIPKYDGELPAPNLYVPVSEPHARRKVEAIMRCFATQRERHWFTDDLFLAMLRIRGMEANSASRYAEAFTCRKLVLDVAGREARAAGAPVPLREVPPPVERRAVPRVGDLPAVDADVA
jgi:LmbE family N-acetylglucosaminyl deacetylase